MTDAHPPALVEVTRDAFVESVHRGHLAIADADGGDLGGVGDRDVVVYPRSALKPFQALASRRWLRASGVEPDAASTAITCASHEGSNDQQVEAARLLAIGGIDESALRCPPDRPVDASALEDDPRPTRLAHNCSGKHAGFLAAQALAGHPVDSYLDPDSALQGDVFAAIAQACGAPPSGPGTDGCGAPAWRVPLAALATAFARLAAADAEAAGADGESGDLAAIRDAMCAHPELVGGSSAVESRLMHGVPGVVAKRGAEGVLGCGVRTAQGPIGLAVKIADGAARASGPAIAPVLAGFGFDVPQRVARPLVLGGGQPHGELRPVETLTALAPVG